MPRKTAKSKATRKPATAKSAGAPKKRKCACLQAHFGLLDKYPAFRANQSRIEHFTAYCRQAGDAALRRTVTKIPVVVHVVHRTASENISDSQIKSQITVLNKDFRAKNSDGNKVPAGFKDLVGDSLIEFELAKRDPAGKATSGITRTKTNQISFSPTEDDVKASVSGGIEPWDTERFLNIWVCTISGGILGYAQFPGGPPDTDGVVVLNTAFGTRGTAAAPFNKGRTTTHEIGHYLNLSHIWGEARIATCSDSDFVDDTPNQFDKNFGKPAFPHISCGNAPLGDMFMNYMDYVDDAAMFMFTREQVTRMQAVLAGPRDKLGT
jgi:hypothetical protein